MFRPFKDQVAPFFVIIGRIGPASKDFVISVTGTPIMLVGVGFGGKSLRHETNFDVRLHVPFLIGVEDFIQNFPIVSRLAGRIFIVSAGGTPFESSRAIAGSEKVVSAEIDGFWLSACDAEKAEVADEFFSIPHCGVVRFVRAEKAPDGMQLAF